MKLLFNVIALLLATMALAAPVPSRSNDALTEGASTSEHTLAHHHHVHNAKHAKHVHREEAEVETRSLFNDELEERSFYEDYTQLERRGPGGDKDKGKGKANALRVFTNVKNLVKAKPKTSPSSAGSSFVHVKTPSDHEVHPFTGHQAGPSRQAVAHAAAHANKSGKPLPPLPGSPHRSNSLPPPASPHHGSDAPPPYSQHAAHPQLHVANPGSPHRSNSVGSIPSPHLSRASSIDWNSMHTGSSVAGSPVRHSP